MKAALDNPEDARLRQAELEAARAGRERLMGAREREYEPVTGVSSVERSTRAPSRDNAELGTSSQPAEAASAGRPASELLRPASPLWSLYDLFRDEAEDPCLP